MAKKDNKQDKVDKDVDNKTLPFRKSDVRDWFEVIMYGLALLMFVKSFVFQNFQIPTSSMENSLLIGDHLMDIECGRAAGCRTVLMIGEGDVPDRACEADHIIRTLGELVAIVGQPL